MMKYINKFPCILAKISFCHCFYSFSIPPYFVCKYFICDFAFIFINAIRLQFSLCHMLSDFDISIMLPRF